MRKWQTWAGEERHSRVHEKCTSLWFRQTQRFNCDDVDETGQGEVPNGIEDAIELAISTFYSNILLQLNFIKCQTPLQMSDFLKFSWKSRRAEMKKNSFSKVLIWKYRQRWRQHHAINWCCYTVYTNQTAIHHVKSRIYSYICILYRIHKIFFTSSIRFLRLCLRICHLSLPLSFLWFLWFEGRH